MKNKSNTIFDSIINLENSNQLNLENINILRGQLGNYVNDLDKWGYLLYKSFI